MAPRFSVIIPAQLLALIRSNHEELKGIYGSPRVIRELRGRGFRLEITEQFSMTVLSLIAQKKNW